MAKLGFRIVIYTLGAFSLVIFVRQVSLHSSLLMQSPDLVSMSAADTILDYKGPLPDVLWIGDRNKNQRPDGQDIIRPPKPVNVKTTSSTATGSLTVSTTEMSMTTTTTNTMKIPNQIQLDTIESPHQALSEKVIPIQRPCRVVIENAIDYHHEVIESVVNRYPLPWYKFNCSTDFPIIYDFALFQNRFPNDIPFYIGNKPKHLNETEFWGWKDYFERNLQYRNITRSANDGTVAYYRKFVTDEEYGRGKKNHDIRKGTSHSSNNDTTGSVMPVDAIIDVSCGINLKFRQVLKQHSHRYCVLHHEVKELEEEVKNKTCWVAPMYPPDYCTFLPIDLPKVDTTSHNHHDSFEQNKKMRIRVCAVGGGGRDHSKIVKMFSKVPFREYNVTFMFSARRIKPKTRRVVSQLGMEDHVQFTYIKDFVEFAKFVVSCDIYLPCTDPKERVSHFRWGAKQLTGSLPQIIAYNLSSVMHVDLEEIYHDYLTAPVEVYTNETGTDVEALKRMIVRIAKDRDMIRER